MDNETRTIIEAKSVMRLLDFGELARYKDLLYFLVLRDIKVLYKQTVLGFAWAVIRPFFSMIVFSIVFGKLAHVSSDGAPYPIFSYAALVPWTYFSTAIAKSNQSLVTNMNMLTKVYFPRMIIPITPVLAGLLDFLIAFLLIGALMAWYGMTPTIHVLFLPFLTLLMVVTASGAGMWLSSLAIQYRDVRHATQFVVQILMYAAPVVWPASLIPEKYRLLYGLYPMAGVIEDFRFALLGTNPMPWDLIVPGTASAFLLLLTGAVYFRKMERRFADVA